MITQTREPTFQNPQGYEIPCDLLQEFERGLDPINPGQSKVPCHVLGYGEISTVFEIQVDTLCDLAFKRMCIFNTLDELQTYVATYMEYNRRLVSDIGLHLPVNGYAAFTCENGRPVFYIIQKKLKPGSIGNNALHHITPQETLILFEAVLEELDKVWVYNRDHPETKVGIDGQISNWAIEGFDPYQPGLSENLILSYIDTSTPICYQDGVEQLNPELFLRSAPPYLVWILRLLFVKDVMTRYYDARKVIIDLIANFYKEQRPELIPDLVVSANEHINSQPADLRLQPIEVKEVEEYYREDEVIWSLYLSMRRFDRYMRKKVFHMDYPYILPGKIKR